MDNSDFDIPDEFDPEKLLLEEAESLAQLGRHTTLAAQVMFDLQQHGALYQYALQRRTVAKEAIAALIAADAKDAVTIARLQAQARSYVEICDFVEQALIVGRNAEDFIRENFGDSPSNDSGS